MISAKALYSVVAVVAGAVGVKLLAPKLVTFSKGKLTQDQAELAIAGTLFALGVSNAIAGYGPQLLLLSLGALAPAAQAKILPMLTKSGTPVSGYPWYVGQVPSGAAMYALPHGQADMYRSAGFPVS